MQSQEVVILSRREIVNKMLEFIDEHGEPDTTTMPGYLYCRYLLLEDELLPRLNSKELDVYKRGGAEALSGRFKNVAPGLPVKLVVYIPKLNLAGVVRRGLTGIDVILDSPTMPHVEALVNNLNSLMEITPMQKKAMEYGAETGRWWHDEANPASYDENGLLLPLGKRGDTLQRQRINLNGTQVSLFEVLAARSAG